MTTVILKTNIHKLIDTINNDTILSRFYELLSKTTSAKEGALWSRLSIEEQEELIEIEKESHHSKNIIAHSEIKKKHKKWL
jgi:hypothetical protein